VTEVEAKVEGARVFVREKSSNVEKKKKRTRVVRVAEAFVSIDKLAIAAEGVTARGQDCKVATDRTELTVKRLRISAQSIVIRPL